MNLSTLKKEAREEFELAIENAPEKTLDGEALRKVLDTLIDKVVEAAEKELIAAEDQVFAEERGYQYGFVKQAFTNFRK